MQLKYRWVPILLAVLSSVAGASVFSVFASPPMYHWQFGITGSLFAAVVGIAVWFSQKAIVSWPLGGRFVVLLLLVSLAGYAFNQYSADRRMSIVSPNDRIRYPDWDPVFFPLRLTGNALDRLDRYKTRSDMLDKESPNGVRALLRQMPDYEKEIQRTVGILLRWHILTLSMVTASIWVIISIVVSSQYNQTKIREQGIDDSKPGIIEREISQGKSYVTNSSSQSRRFRVALSFPGEHRDFVREVAESLAAELTAERVFYDEWYEVDLLGTAGDLKLQSMYEQSDLVIPFFSKGYDKPWCSMEWETIRGILLNRRKDDAVIPVHLDDTDIAGWSPVNFGIRVRGRTPKQIADLILKALAMRTSSGTAKALKPSASGTGSSLQPPTTANSQHSPTTGSTNALGVWREKLDYLQQQEAILADPAQKFTVKKQIEEATQKIKELGGNP